MIAEYINVSMTRHTRPSFFSFFFHISSILVYLPRSVGSYKGGPGGGREVVVIIGAVRGNYLLREWRVVVHVRKY